ncbi:uncharacterized protein PV06_11258 [Exophiala oligosperma]|uniref:Amino acid permease/ SLC12A domain-containing protein n=1 Tax=Exophiala oligosperma TaxID=215243 RepID=A0A0D2A862_9EURO|nr:uncharacterized protein PV06_11258 [Exophiala oligosperma]KIW36491.1 hypothetical protein PV06_11258 [Exophiala oligosperma]
MSGLTKTSRMDEVPPPEADIDVSTGRVSPKTKPFKLWSTLGIAYSITSTPLAIGTYLAVSIGVGGSPVSIFGYIMVVILDMCICVSLAEMAAIMPHSAGQIFWTATLAPKRRARALSYIVGWLTSAGYFCWTAACFLITSQLIFALVEICRTTFIVQPWHYYLGYCGTGLFAVVVNIPLFKWYPYILNGLVVYINAASLFVMVALLVRAYPKQSADFVFVDFVNSTGWNSKGVVFFLGLLPGLTAVNGFDCAAHMAEEMPNPRRQVPQVMVLSALLSAVSGLVMLLVYMFCITNPVNLLAPVGGQPIAQLMVDSFNDLPLTIVGVLVFIICFLFASSTLLTTFSRVLWSFSRDDGMPFSGTMGKMSTGSSIPVHAVLLGFLVCILIGLLELGSSTALNAILGAGILFIFASYAIPITCALLQHRKDFAATHYFDLGKIVGRALNVISVVWICFIFVWLCFPLYVPVTGVTMNYAIVVFAIVAMLSTINWFAWSNKRFRYPEAMVQTSHGEISA